MSPLTAEEQTALHSWLDLLHKMGGDGYACEVERPDWSMLMWCAANGWARFVSTVESLRLVTFFITADGETRRLEYERRST